MSGLHATAGMFSPGPAAIPAPRGTAPSKGQVMFQPPGPAAAPVSPQEQLAEETYLDVSIDAAAGSGGCNLTRPLPGAVPGAGNHRWFMKTVFTLINDVCLDCDNILGSTSTSSNMFSPMQMVLLIVHAK